MPTDFAFRLSTYLTLFLSCLALGYAEWDLLPEASVFTLVVAGLLGLAFRQEGKLELSLVAANRLGMVIGIVAMCWLAFQVVRPTGGLIYRLPWPASMLPYLGPLVMILMPAKLFRPKHVGDWWTMHGVGLAAVALGCALTEDLFFAVLAAAYLTCGAWSLSLFFLRRAAGAMPAIPGRPLTEPRAIVVTGEIASAPKSRLGRAFAARPLWALVAAAGIAVALFLATPRIDGPQWSLTTQREVGFGGEDSAPDLNRGGTLAGRNSEVAFEVYVRNADGTFKDDVPGDQRWRARPFFDYDQGKWRPNTPLRTMFAAGVKGPGAFDPDAPAPRRVPGPGEVTYEFVWRAKKKDAVLADPVMWTKDQASPVFSGNQPWAQLPDGSFFPYNRDAFGQYVQINRPPDEMDVGPTFELTNWNPRGPDGRPVAGDPFTGYEVLVASRLTGVRDLAREFLARLVDAGRLPREVLDRLDPVTRAVAFEDQESVARAISAQIANSGEYEYALSTPPVPKGVDPIEDFLTRSKVGSCERFATAVVQLLRGLGIPSKMVIGFKGCEHEGAGKYVVRQEHAHAWVEVLVRRPTPPGFVPAPLPPATRSLPGGGVRSMAPPFDPEVRLFGGQSAPEPKPPPGPPPTAPAHLYAWLTLDPTPGGGYGLAEDSLAGSVRSIWSSVGEWFSSLVVKYNPEMRAKVAAQFLEWLRHWWLPTTLSVGVVSVSIAILRLVRAAARRRRLTVRPDTSIPPWYARYLTAAALRGAARGPAETPAEHAARFASGLPSGLRSWPRTVADLYAAVRYGGRTADPSAVAEVDAGLARLAPK
jgi:hypothetical protein